jgi:tetratricopeptide (TPR) repeat protein
MTERREDRIVRAAPLGAAAVTVATLLAPLRAAAHVGPAERIAALDRAIATSPRDADLHAQRAALHEVEGDWSGALADLDRAALLDPNREDALALPRARVLLAAGDGAGAIALASRALAACGTSADPEAHLVVARGLRAAGNPGLAVAADDAYARALGATDAPKPDDVLERAAAARDGIGSEHALAVLDEGVARLGPLATLQLAAIEIEVELGRIDAALARIEAVAATARRREQWDARAGAILEAAGRAAEARRAYEAARCAIDALPRSRRGAPATAALADRVTAALARRGAAEEREGAAPAPEISHALEEGP